MDENKIPESALAEPTPPVVEKPTATVEMSNESTPSIVKNKFATEKKKRKLPKWLKLTITLVIVAALGFGIYTLVNKLTAKQEKPPMTASAFRGQLASRVTGYGTVVPKEKSEYGAKTRGKVTDVYVAAGDLVKPGDKLFTIDPSELTAEFEAAQSAKTAAQDRLKVASQNLQYTNVTAPFKGKLMEAGKFKKGDTIGVGEKIGLMVDDSQMKLELYFSYAYIDEIVVGQTANVSVPQNMTSVTGTVSQVDKIKKVSTDGSLLFRVHVTVPNPGTLAKDTVAVASVTTNVGEAFPAEGGKLDYINSQEVKTKLGGELLYVDVMDFGEYKGGQAMVTISGDGLNEAYSNAKKAYDDAVKKVDELAQSINNKDIIAEIEGMVSGVMVEIGDELKASGTPVLTISNTTSLFVDINIDELDVGKLQIGMPATVIHNNGTESTTWQGTLSTLSFEAKKNQDSNPWGGGAVAYFPAKIAIANDGKLLPNMNVDFEITSVIKEDCLLVPSGAVLYAETGTVVFVQTDTLKGTEVMAEVAAEKVPKGFTAVTVEVGLSDDVNVEILSGLEDGVVVFSEQMPDQGGMGGGMGGDKVIRVG